MYRKVFPVIFLGFFLISISSREILADDYHIIRNELQSWIKNGLTQEQIATKLDVNPSTISRFVSHKIQRSPKILHNFKTKYHQEYLTLTTPKKRPNIPKNNLIQAHDSKVIRKIDFDVEASKQSPSREIKPQSTETQSLKKEVVFLKTDPNPIPIKTVIIKHEDIKRSPAHLLIEERTLKKEEIKLPDLIYKPSFIRTKAIRSPKAQFEKAPVVVSYRDEGNGKGAFYDHYTLQRATDFPTCISHALGMNINAIKSHIDTTPYNLPLGKNVDGRPIPEVTTDSFEGGLLGVCRT